MRLTSTHFVRGSSDAVGSSSRSTSGRSDSTDAIAARFFSPPDSSNGARSARWAMSIWRSASSQHARTSSCDRPSWSGPNATSSNTVGAEQLDVGVLEDQPHLAVEAERVLPVGDRGDVAAERPHRARRSAR